MAKRRKRKLRATRKPLRKNRGVKRVVIIKGSKK